MAEVDEQQVQTLVQQMQNNNLVQLKLIAYLEADLEAKNREIERLKARLSESEVKRANKEDG